MKINNSTISILYGSIFSGLSVVFGAFGAHYLQKILLESQLNTFQTAVDYQMYHGLALLFWSLYQMHFENAGKITTILFVTGILLFSGSLYLLVLTNLTFVVFLTPIGGAFFIMGWISIIVCVIKDAKNKT